MPDSLIYTFGGLPEVTTVEELRAVVAEEFQQISRSMVEQTVVDLRPVYREPERPRPGMVVYADGSTWNPGGGEGLYVYNLSSVWVKL